RRSWHTPWPVVVSASYDAEADFLEMRFPGGEVLSGSAAPNGDELTIQVGGREQRVRVVPGPWAERLSELGGRAVKLARVRRDGRPPDEAGPVVSAGPGAPPSRAGRRAGGARPVPAGLPGRRCRRRGGGQGGG